MQQPKMVQLAQQLLETARAGKVKWREGLASDSYTASLPDISLIITRTMLSPLEGYRLDLVNDKGKIIESISHELSDPLPRGQSLREIHDLARRDVLDIDGNIDKALEYLRRA